VNKITSIALVLIMSLQCFYKLGVITYFHLNREYIAEVLCINKEKPITMCYGQCFLNRSLDPANDTAADEGTMPVGKQQVDLPIFLISESNYRFAKTLEPDKLTFLYIIETSSKHSSAPFHPPATV
jgi:hypothetical protein